VTWQKKANDLIGIRVVDEQGGNDIGTVKDILFTDKGSTVNAIIVKKNFWHPEVIIKLKDIKKISKDYMVVDTKRITAIEKKYRNSNRFINNGDITGLTVLTKEGERVGVIKDVLIDLERGKVYAYEMSESFFDDLLDGRKLIPASKDATINGDKYVISKQTHSNIKSKKKGLKKLLNIKKEEFDSGQ